MPIKPNKTEVGSRIKDIRISRNETMEEFATLLDSNKSNVSRWERGVNIPNDATLKEIASLGSISVNELLQGSHKHLVRKTLNNALLERGELFEKIVEYLSKTKKEAAKDIDDHAIKFINENFNSIYDFLYTADLNNPEYNKAYDPTTIIKTAINYFEYRLNAAEQSYKLNDDVDLYLLSPIKFKNLENKDDYEDKTKYEIDFSLSLTKTDWLSERPSRVELDYICYPTLEITLNHNKDTHYYYISGMSDFVDSHYERIYGEKTYKQLKDRLLEFALKKDYLKEYNIESFEELT